jgi:hypothetical protein
MEREKTDLGLGQLQIAHDAGVSDRTLRDWIKRFNWRDWMPKATELHDGKRYGKPIDVSVVQSTTNAAASARAVIATEMPVKRAEAGRASGRKRQSPGSGTSATKATEAIATDVPQTPPPSGSWPLK